MRDKKSNDEFELEGNAFFCMDLQKFLWVKLIERVNS